MASLSERFGESGRAEVLSLTLNDDGLSCPSPGTGPGTGTPTPAPTQPPSTTVPPVRDGDYDADNDGLIEIRNVAQLDAIRYDLDGNGAIGNDAYEAAFPGAADDMGCPSGGCGGYELVTNLDFDTNGNGRVDAGDAFWNGGDGWLPIGRDRRFYSTFDGREHTISNLYISRTSADNVGLFGWLSYSGRIRQLGLVKANVTGRSNVGGLVGYMDRDSSVTHSYVTGDVIGNEDVGGLVGENGSAITDSHANSTVSGVNNIGGLTGRHRGGTISRSHADGEVNSSGSHAGGLVGNSSGVINSSYATGDVFAVGWEAGGLVGVNGSTINGSYATGRVTGSKWQVGGLVGKNWGTINGSYSTASVTGAGGDVGGLVGWHCGGGKINSSYAIGNVTGNVESEGIGGLVGGIVSRSGCRDGGTVTFSYWNTETTGQSSSAGSPDTAGKTTAQLQAPTGNTGIYAGWSASWWDFGTSSQYPALKYGGLSVALQRGEAAQTSSGAGPTGPKTLAGIPALPSASGTASLGTATDGYPL